MTDWTARALGINGQEFDEFWTRAMRDQLAQEGGTPFVSVTTRAPGLGKTVIASVYVGLRLGDGSHVSATGVQVVREATRACRPDLRRWAEKLGTKGVRDTLGEVSTAGLPVVWQHFA